MTVRPWWRDGPLIDLPGALVWVGDEAGLVLYERNLALLAALRDDTLVPRLVTAHEDLLVFRAGVAAGTRRP
jgi:hypothetical protein